MWGDGLLISPVLFEHADTVKAYLPKYERWYDLHKVSSSYNGAHQSLTVTMCCR